MPPSDKPAITAVFRTGRWTVFQLDSQWLVVPTGYARFYKSKDSAVRRARQLDTDDKALAS